MPFRRNVPEMIGILVATLLLAAHLCVILIVQDAGVRSAFTNFFRPVLDLIVAVMMFLAAWRLQNYSRRMALAWLTLGSGVVFLMIADILWMVRVFYLGDRSVSAPTDILYFVYYLLLLAAILLIPSRKQSTMEWIKTTIDVFIVMLASLLFFWNFVIGPLINIGATDPLTLGLSLAYPVGDLVLIWAILSFLYRPAGSVQSPALWLLVLGGSVIVLCDAFYSHYIIQNQYQNGSLLDAGYTLGYLLFALAGLYQYRNAHTSWKFDFVQADLNRQAEARRGTGGWQAYIPYIGVIGTYGLLIGGSITHLPMTVIQLTVSVGVIITLIVLRQLLTVRENNMLAADLQFALSEVQRQALMLERANKEMQVEIHERRRAEERLSYDALHDSLTGLPNRALFLDRLGLAGRKKKRSPSYQFAVLFLDLDSFKVVNDSLGHVVGDQLLIRTAQVLLNCVRATDTVARLGGDEFVILLEDVKNQEDVLLTADRLQSELSNPLQLEGTRVFVSVSIGIVDQVDAYEVPEDVLRDADLAMYQAKSHGRARYEIFHTGMRANAILRMALENDLRRAIDEKEFVLYYQPILELSEQRLVGFEALVRWQHPERGLVPPAEFITVAEETGLILPLGRWVLFEACRQASEWQERFHLQMPIRVNVNISGRQLKQPDFVAMVMQALEENHLPANCLALEVTESVCLDSLEIVAGTLEALQLLGVETQIDDFGTGYSSLSYLQRLPVRSIKIDRSFIHDINNVSSSAPDIIRAIFSMVNDLGLKAVAEGIENEAQLSELKRLRCSYVQGFLLAVPMDELNLERWLSENRPTRTGRLNPARATGM
jgi:diguanylate cyclase (GGDEF)-like protein